MSRKNIIVATPFSEDLNRWQDVLSNEQDLQITAHEPGLMELFNTVEHNPPKIALIAADLCATDEFELIVTLFKALDVRWLMFHSLGQDPRKWQAVPHHTKNADLFSLSLNDANRTLVSQVRSTGHATQRTERPVAQQATPPSRRFKRMVLIGSSTGGVDALKTVLSKFGSDCPPTVVVQHTSKGFGAGLVQVLKRSCAAQIQLFESNAPLQSGTIYVVAGLAQHVVLSPGKRPHLQSKDAPPMSGHCPSIDMFFTSCVPYANRVVGCILTGMGSDGAQGLLKLREAGARTLSQDRESSVVYGMPAAAWSNGGSMQQVSLSEIGKTLLKEATL